MILVLDTETTGKCDFNKRASDPSQPHIVRASGIAVFHDGTTQEFDSIVKPNGWDIPKEVSDIHGITMEIANEKGINEETVAGNLKAVMMAATMVIGHNIQFDKFIVRIALRRYGLLKDEEDAAWKAMPTFCTMRESTGACQLPGGRGGQFKWPTLSEAYFCATGRKMEGAHDSVKDVRACLDIYNWLKAGCQKPEPQQT